MELNEQTRATIDTCARWLIPCIHRSWNCWGWLGALRERADALSYGGAPGLRVIVEAAGDPAALPAAVEVAAYYIAQEALGNVVRHSGARQVTLRLWVQYHP